MNSLNNKKILIIHFRVGKTDGVSLEIENWRNILKKEGVKIKLCSGPINQGADFVIKNLEQQLNLTVYRIDEDSFGKIIYHKNPKHLEKRFIKLKRSLEREFDKVFIKFKPDRIIVSNIFSVGEHLPAASALLASLDKRKIRTVLIHHDFFWEAVRCKKPSNTFVEKILNNILVPKRTYITHAVINKIAQKDILRKRGIKAEILYDSINFSQRSFKKTKNARKLLEKKRIDKDDLIFLQATRIVRRKNIEVAVDLIKKISEKKNLRKLSGKILYNGKLFDANKNKIILLLPGYAEKRDTEYMQLIKNYGRKMRIKIVFIGKEVGSRNDRENGDKKVCLEDIYPFADIITYPSHYEGFGNQFLEAIFAKKPIVVFEYPVFVRDIKPKGFDVISLGQKITRSKSTGLVKISPKKQEKAVGEIIEILKSKKKYKGTVEKNYILGKKHFSFESTRKTLKKLLN